MPRPKGYISVLEVRDEDGRVIPPAEVVRRGIIPNAQKVPAGWGAGRDEIGLGPNLFVDVGRQITAYAMGARSPVSSYTVQQFGFGTGTAPAQVTDVALQSPATFNGGGALKTLDGVDFPAPFVMRAQFTLGTADGNGLLVSEWGLFSGGGTLIARSVRLPVQKSSAAAITATWRIRF